MDGRRRVTPPRFQLQSRPRMIFIGVFFVLPVFVLFVQSPIYAQRKTGNSISIENFDTIVVIVQIIIALTRKFPAAALVTPVRLVGDSQRFDFFPFQSG